MIYVNGLMMSCISVGAVLVTDRREERCVGIGGSRWKEEDAKKGRRGEEAPLQSSLASLVFSGMC